MVEDILGATRALQSFAGTQLTKRIADLEAELKGAGEIGISQLLAQSDITHELLGSAYLLKKAAGQINVMIHAIGILLVLPQILRPGESISYLSLGAGNTGELFDLETDYRVAEFKFIHWRGGSEAIRQNALFKDLYLLAEHQTSKCKFVYVLGREHPLRFLTGRRALNSVMSRNRTLWDDFQRRYGSRFTTVGEYYGSVADRVVLEDVSPFLSELTAPDFFDPEDLSSDDCDPVV